MLRPTPFLLLLLRSSSIVKKKKKKDTPKVARGGESATLSLSKRRGKDRKIEGKEEDAYTKRHAR